NHFPRGAVVPQILCPGVENDRQHLVLAGLFLRNYDLPFAAEHPADGAGLSQIPAVAAHHVPNLADYALPVGRDHLQDHSHSAWTVTLEIYFFVLFPSELPRTA